MDSLHSLKNDTSFIDDQFELTGEIVTLKITKEEHIPDLYLIKKEYPEIWTYLTTPVDKEEQMNDYVMSSIKNYLNKIDIPFTVFNKDGKIVGATRIYNIDESACSCELGHTFYHPEVQRTGVNTEVKYLMLCYIFEVLQLNRVQQKADAKNEKSVRAMERLGAVREGTLRMERPVPGGYVRDAALFSYVINEWQDKKEHIEKLMRRYDA